MKNSSLFTGEVYGSEISQAKQSKGMFETLKKLKQQKIELFIVSHKTLYPYAGPKVNLHHAALKWLTLNEFFDANKLDFKRENVFFELTIESKIKEVKVLDTHYVDDLTKILELITPKIIRIHYNPKGDLSNTNDILTLRSWEEIQQVLKGY